MEYVFRDLKGKCCMVYIDDVVIYSKDEQEHLQHIQQVFHCLFKSGLALNMKKKCNFIQKSLTFLGHTVSGEGLRADPGKVSAIRAFPTPQSLKEVQRFLGLAGWYHRFIPNFSEKTPPLHALRQKNAKKKHGLDQSSVSSHWIYSRWTQPMHPFWQPLILRSLLKFRPMRVK